MRILLVLITLWTCTSMFAQIPTTEFIGRLVVSHPQDSSSIYIGRLTGENFNLSGLRRSTFVGHNSGQANTDGFHNTFMGELSGHRNTSGDENTFIGQAAGAGNTLGSTNTFIGQAAGGLNSLGSRNTFIGHAAGLLNSTGSKNTFVGGGAGSQIKEGSGNIVLGERAGPTMDVSNRLYIDNETSDSSLIYGEFDNDVVFINGSLNVTNGISGVFNGISDINAKEYFRKIDIHEILRKVGQIPITEWQYKNSKVRHIGPMAQDFYSAFFIGASDKTIATVDADGILIASVQALSQENKVLQENYDKLSDKLEKMNQKIEMLEKMILEH